MVQIQGVLFDMDGVLVDSEQYICKAAIQMFAEKGLTVQPNDFLPFVGSGENRYLGGVAEKYQFPFDLETDKIRTYKIYEEMVRGQLTALAGVESFIQKCKKKGLKLAVATSADKIKMLINLHEIKLSESTFDATVNGQDVLNKKPDPEIFILAATKLGLYPQNCLVVEDAINGVKAAKAAGSKCLALTTSFSISQLEEADWFAADLSVAPQECINW